MGIKETLGNLTGKGKEPEPEKQKRGSYKERECPYCQKVVRNLGNHIKMAHSAASPSVSRPALVRK